MLVVLLSGQKSQTIHTLTLSGMKQLGSKITSELKTLLKTSKPGNHVQLLVFKAYPAVKHLCVVTCLKQYLLQTSQVWSNKLWLSFNRPH